MGNKYVKTTEGDQGRQEDLVQIDTCEIKKEEGGLDRAWNCRAALRTSWPIGGAPDKDYP